MSKAFEYKIVSGHSEDVERQVQGLTCQGWFLHGYLVVTSTYIPDPVTMCWDAPTLVFSQALIKEYEQPGAWG